MMAGTPPTMHGRTAIISGSSTGIGAATARELSSRGANIVLNYPFPGNEAECNEVGAQLKTPWIAVCADLSTVDGPQTLVDAAVARFGHIDILVNNAGTVTRGATWEVDAVKWDQAMALNVRGVFLLTKAVLPRLTPYKPSSPPAFAGVKGGSRIICIGSGAGRQPQDDLLAYSAGKGAIHSLINHWAKELPPKYGCTVNGVAPGPVKTDNLRREYGDRWDEACASYASVTPCEGAMAEEDDIAWTVAYLAEDRSKWVNGEYINVNGGLIIA
ncbi:uncharacterized protein A1O5_10629 [Cladophialophora psammophila CBS 110553]|uniref:3-oxoacyl-[acyl-carrier protein] reductase n=1 Tax=Cladophialophora psammophila CBS 110553 TaxID=1182543 RepID=W9WED2_9EURO|nr:uncharacterized protein A1O5_10629 [Cladophialophora psammophila CBS 110553]EXJ66477.1 hypothetical protein A1O5_10629 [Cladophialophora psammophila CBS 110553]